MSLQEKLPLITDVVDAIGVLQGHGRIALKQELLVLQPSQLREMKNRVGKYVENLGYAERVQLTRRMIGYLQSNSHLPAEPESQLPALAEECLEPAYAGERVRMMEMQHLSGCHIIDPSNPPPTEADLDMEFRPASVNLSSPYAHTSSAFRVERKYHGRRPAGSFSDSVD